MSELEQVMQKLEGLEVSIASIQECLGLLLEALQPSPAPPEPVTPPMASYEQMYGPIEAAPVVSEVPVPTPRPAPGRLYRWFVREDLG